mgnify:CR=1 FL=1
MKTLKASNLAKSYDGRQIVKDVSMEVKSGQIVGLLGPNGAGKTTCFYMIVNLAMLQSMFAMFECTDNFHCFTVVS